MSVITRIQSMATSQSNQWFFRFILVIVLTGCQGITEEATIQSPTAAQVPATVVPTPLPPTETLMPTHTPEPTATATPDIEEATVLLVLDGDTIKVEMEGENHIIRYLGITAAPRVDPNYEYMNFACTSANRDLVGEQVVIMEKDVSEEDDFGRLLRYVFLSDGTFVNAELVRLGFAQAEPVTQNTIYQDLIAEAENEAKNLEIGIWEPNAGIEENEWEVSVEELSIPDGTWVDFGETFTKSWKVKITGTYNWNEGVVKLFMATGTDMRAGQSRTITMDAHVPADEFTIDLTFIAPEEAGEYTNEWKFRAPDSTEFGSLTLMINVGKEP